MEEKLKAIVERIEASSLSANEKAELYILISDGLQSVVWPIMVQYMPKEQLAYLAADPKSRVTVESYSKLITDTITDPNVLTEIDSKMDAVLSEVDTSLTEAGV